jgi:putative ABC transport system permease protein
MLRWICPPPLLEEIEGDLNEKFAYDLSRMSVSRARLRFVVAVLRYCRPGIMMRNKFNPTPLAMQLLQNNLQMAFRNMKHDLRFSLINLFGLSTSMAAGLLILQYAVFEMNHDRGSWQPPDIYRIYTSTFRDGETGSRSALTTSTLRDAISARLPDVAQVARLYTTRYWFDCTLAFTTDAGKHKIFNEKNIYYADEAALKMFSHKLVSGGASALSTPYSIVISESVAARYFGDQDPLGKMLHLKGSNEDHDYLVTGVMTNPRPDSHLDADVFASLSTIDRNPGFQFADVYTYVQLVRDANLGAVTEKLHQLADELLPAKNGRSTKLDLEPIHDIHLHSPWIDQIKPSGDEAVVYLLLAIATLVLAMAWINYVNLTMARSFARAREVGIRKVSGATRAQVAVKFITEVAVYNVIGIGCAALLAYIVSPYFYRYVQVPVPNDYLLQMPIGSWLYFTAALVGTGLLFAGLAPALTISALNPLHVLKGKLVIRNRPVSFRKVAVVFQFICVISLAVAVFAFNRQFTFLRQQDVGVEIDRMLVLRAPANVDSTYRRQLRNFKNELTSSLLTQGVSASSAVPGNLIGWTASVNLGVDERSGDHFIVNVIDEDFVATYGLNLLAGRNFTTADFPEDRFGDKIEPVILNRAGLEFLGILTPEDAIEKTVYWGDNECRIVGVVEDFYQQSLKHAIQPQLFTANTGPMLSLRLNPDRALNFRTTLDQIHDTWNRYFPQNAFDYFFLSSAFDEQYAKDEQLARVFHFFTLLAVLISGLGLFALSLMSVQERTREVGIRKALGASAGQLLHLLTREYTILIAMAALIAIPLSWWGISHWLSGFAQHIESGLWLYVLPVLFVLLAAYATISAHTMGVVQMNPTESLKQRE